MTKNEVSNEFLKEWFKKKKDLNTNIKKLKEETNKEEKKS